MPQSGRSLKVATEGKSTIFIVSCQFTQGPSTLLMTVQFHNKPLPECASVLGIIVFGWSPWETKNASETIISIEKNARILSSVGLQFKRQFLYRDSSQCVNGLDFPEYIIEEVNKRSLANSRFSKILMRALNSTSMIFDSRLEFPVFGHFWIVELLLALYLWLRCDVIILKENSFKLLGYKSKSERKHTFRWRYGGHRQICREKYFNPF